MNKTSIKKILGEIPYAAELYWGLIQRHKAWQSHFDLDLLESNLAKAVEETEPFYNAAKTRKSIFIFASLHYWIEFSTFLSLAMAGKGHAVTLSFLPYSSWDEPITKFDLRRQNLYARGVLSQVSSILNVQSLWDVTPFSSSLPPALEKAVEEVSIFDAQYSLQVEDITKDEDVYQLRYQRNQQAAKNARAWLMAHTPDVVIVPNGTIQEMGVVYRVAQYLDIPVVTFEFGDKREHIWLAQNAEIMRHETDALWEARAEQPLGGTQMNQLEEFFSARQDAKAWKNFTRKWQDSPTKGGKAVRKRLGLDDRPVILLATNVLGDSLTLDRQVFSQNMAEWIERTVQFFVERQDVQLVIRVHPGETLMHGTSMVDVVQAALPTIPEHLHMVKPEEKINTYDLVSIPDLGLVYTTTVGLEMALRGIPVIVAGQTHYRNRGFTYDPQSWVHYFAMLNELLDNLDGARLTQAQIELSWRYAYLFFFVFPKPFPWHLLDLQEDIQARPMSFVLGEEGSQRYKETFEFLAGEPLQW
jgi:hypothetical protein